MKNIDNLKLNQWFTNPSVCAIVKTAYSILKWPISIGMFMFFIVYIKYSAILFVGIFYPFMFWYKLKNESDNSTIIYDKALCKIIPILAIIAAIVSIKLLYNIESSKPIILQNQNNFGINLSIIFASVLGTVTSIILTWSATLFYKYPVASISMLAICIMNYFLLQYSYGCTAVLGIIALGSVSV